jgi:hypothetical protein
MQQRGRETGGCLILPLMATRIEFDGVPPAVRTKLLKPDLALSLIQCLQGEFLSLKGKRSNRSRTYVLPKSEHTSCMQSILPST